MLNKFKNYIKGLMLKYISPENMLFLIHLKEAKKALNFPFKRAVMMEKPKPKTKVLVLAPHPDDEVLGLGGTLNLHLAAGNEILIVYMTDGSGTVSSVEADEMAAARMLETKSIADTYGLTQKFLNFKDGQLETNDQSVSAIKTILADFCPDEIFLPSYLDSHKDHFTTNHILFEALKDNNKIKAKIFGCEVHSNIPFPNYAVDITSYFDEKLKMISAYKSQTAIFGYEQLCKARNNLNYTMYIDSLSTGYAEIFLYFSSRSYVKIFDKLIRSIYDMKLFKNL